MFEHLFRGTISGLVAIGGYLFGNSNNELLIALLIFVITDYVSGVICGIVEHKLSSAIGFKGIAKKILLFGIVAVTHILDQRLGLKDALMTATIFFYLANEGLSIVENSVRLGLPMPNKIRSVLVQLKNQSDNEDKDDYSLGIDTKRADYAEGIERDDEDQA